MRRGTACLVLMSGLLVATLSAAPSGNAHDEALTDAGNGVPVVSALRANGARILTLGERGGLQGHFVELANGDAYGLYVTPDGHAVTGLLYGPDGTLLTGRQIEAARGERGEAAGTLAAVGAGRAARDSEISADNWRSGPKESAGGAVAFADAYTSGRNVSAVEEPGLGVPPEQGDPLDQGVPLFRRSASAFGFTLGHTGPLAVAFADPGCRWSRSAVARLARLALDGRLRLHAVPVGVLGSASAREAAAIASAVDPAMAWFEGAARPASPEGGRRVARNNALFDAWGAGAVPLIAWRTAEGRVAHRLGDIDDLHAWLETLPHE